MRPLPHAAGDSAAHHEAQTQAGATSAVDRPKYRQRNIIERMFGWLKKSRRIGTHYDKFARSFAAMVTLVCTLRCLRQYFSYKT
ncbi:transposase [Pseudomonas sp. R3.Fl]|uniref:transposase n=1 Tax=Pseudomonas citronellolis TaxID=53408 RepID=UPI00201DE0E3|nr:transposase [Pseudomonas sp. R3.Fl]MCL6692263.1 transposase [Pseudomonas sp. R3.Fl]